MPDGSRDLKRVSNSGIRKGLRGIMSNAHTDLVKSIVNYIDILQATGWPIYGFKSATASVPIGDDRWMKVGKKGNADVTLCLLGQYIGIEAKTGTGRQSDDQKLAQEDIEKAGGIYLVVRTIDEGERALKSIRARIERQRSAAPPLLKIRFTGLFSKLRFIQLLEGKLNWFRLKLSRAFIDLLLDHNRMGVE